MRMTAEQKEAAKRGIVDAAGRLFRRDGYVGVGVDGIAQAMNQTAGAVYSHYGAKLDVFRAVVEAGLARLAKGAERARGTGAPDWVLGFARQYLSPQHRAAVADGCLLPALSPDVTRAGPDIRRLFEHHAGDIARHLAEGCDEASSDAALATGWAVLALCAGGVMLSRAVADEEVANQILASCRAAAARVVAADRPPALHGQPPS